MMKKSFYTAGILLMMCFCLGAVQAAIVPSSGETILFSDDFSDNSNGWSNITTAAGGASISDGVWKAADGLNTGSVTSSVTLPSQINLKDGDVSVYFRASVNDRWSNERFGVSLTDGSSQAGFHVQAGDAGYFTYTTSTGSNTTRWGSPSGQIVTGTGFINYKLTVAANGQDGGGRDIYTASFFMNGFDDGTGNDYGLVYTMPFDMYFDSGKASALEIYTRNTGAVTKMDELVVTQIPEAGTLGLVGLATGMLVLLKRYSHSR
ncbi:hypothetical protein P3T73_00255 [Kiritimatiellota bacterium B12222]|nr:hypothetical protein P3T73_00255 [Kiritimatiellota bacterium B12222]